MTAKEITAKAQDDGLLSDRLIGRTPWQTMKSKLSVDIRTLKDRSEFVRTSPGKFQLRIHLTSESTAYDAKRHEPPPSRENVLVVPLPYAQSMLPFQGVSKNARQILDELASCRTISFVNRLEAEEDESRKQLICYVLIERDDSLLTYRRGSYNRTDQSLRGSMCAGFGGHVTSDDCTLFASETAGIYECARRELVEELILPEEDLKRLESEEAFELLGFINDDSSQVGRQHFAAVVKYKVSNSTYWDQPERGEKAITQLKWVQVDQLGHLLREFEYWTQLCLRAFFLSDKELRPSYLIRRRSQLKPPHVLCVVGEIGSGKSEATKVFTNEYNYTEVNSGKVLSSLLERESVTEDNRRDFQRQAIQFISRPSGPERLARAIYEEASLLTSKRVLIDGIRQASTLDEIKRAFSPLRVAILYVHTPPDVAFEFYRNRQQQGSTVMNFIGVREAEVESEVKSFIVRADCVIYNWNGKALFHSTIQQLMNDLGVYPA